MPVESALAPNRPASSLATHSRRGSRDLEALIDQELSSTQGANTKFAEALTAIAGHIHGEHCPVCGRDFSEVSSIPLAAKVARLITASVGWSAY
jgi:DNA repair protein SbcC/Rad50